MLIRWLSPTGLAPHTFTSYSQTAEKSMLRSRGKVMDIHDQWPARTTPNAWFRSSDIRTGLKYRFRVTRLRYLLPVLAIVLVICFGYVRSRLGHGSEKSRVAVDPRASNGTGIEPLGEGRETGLEDERNVVPPRRAWKYPLVDRTILDKLDRVQEFYAPEFYDLQAASPTTVRPHWPPKVTRIPECPSCPIGGLHLKSDLSNTICESAKHPRPCQFLLPLRIAEQESKARIHLTQIVLLARALNRTLVLPNVGKSKIGACFKWDMGTYYDIPSLAGTLDEFGSDQEWFVELERFKGWLDGREQQEVKSQLVSIGSTLPARTTFRKEVVYSNPDVSVLAYDTFGVWERDLPGCFTGKFDKLALETMPVFMSASNTLNKDGSVVPIESSVVDAFSAILPRSMTQDPIEFDDLDTRLHVKPESEKQVLVVNWDLRHPIFPALSSSKAPFTSLQYSKHMHNLAKIYAPKNPYLAVQWRMETVAPELLEDCAHSLVDVMSRLLHDSVLAENVTSVWLASDYPYPVVNHGPSQRRPSVIAKSGTFKDFEVRHEKAIDILRRAFNAQGELNKWKLTDFAGVNHTESDLKTDLLNDSGVLGILDKLISIKANLFISGDSRCSRRRCIETHVLVDTRG